MSNWIENFPTLPEHDKFRLGPGQKFISISPEKFLNESYESYYWIGFLMADGCMKNNSIALSLCIKDLEHMKKLCSFAQINKIKLFKDKTQCYTTINNKKICREIREKFHLIERKTYNPPDLSYLEGDKFIAFLIGFIDGDGCIYYDDKKKAVEIRIKLYISWMNNLDLIRNKLVDLSKSTIPPPKIAKQYKTYQENGQWLTSKTEIKEYALLVINKHEISCFLKEKIKELKLPAMERKWVFVNENYKNRFQKCKIKNLEFQKLIEQGLCLEEICLEMNMSEASYYRYLYPAMRKYKMTDTSVIIQGPLNKRPQNLIKQIDKLLPLGCEIIVSCWETCDDSILDAYRNKIILVKSPVPSHNLNNNLPLQILSTLNGLKRATKKLSLKIRSDEYTHNIERFVKIGRKTPNKYTTSNIFFIPPKDGEPHNSLHSGDHHIVSLTQNLLKSFQFAWDNLAISSKFAVESYLCYSFLKTNSLEEIKDLSNIEDITRIMKENLICVDINKLGTFEFSCAGKYYSTDEYLFNNGFNKSIKSIEEL